MIDPTTEAEACPPLSVERRVDAVCLRFESAWRRSGERPRIEDYLADAPESDRAVLQRELQRLVAELGGSCPSPGPGSLHFPGYEIRGVLDAGGMGVVSEAWQVNAERLVALKCIRTGQLASAEEVRRFKAEARAVAGLDHPNIVPIYDVGEHNGLHYFTMKLVPGGSLAKQIARGPLPSRRAAEIVAVVAHAIHHAHGKGILHRDLKPGNILLDEEGQPHVADFGLAKRLGTAEAQTQTGAIVGTPGYMAPEQAGSDARQISPAADVYALGAVLYALLTGRPPYEAKTPLETVLLQVLGNRPAPPHLLNPMIEKDLETICLKCLEKKPEDRYLTAAKLAEELECYLAGKPISARRPSWLESLHGIIIRDRYEPTTSKAVPLAGAVIVPATHLLIWWLVRTGQPSWMFWVAYASNLASMWALMVYAYRRRRNAVTQEDRHLFSIYIGHTVAIPVLWLASGMPCDERLFALYPALATLYGLSYFAQGSLYWGRFYLFGTAWFVLALLMPLRLDWAPWGYAALYGLGMLVLYRSLSRRRK